MIGYFDLPDVGRFIIQFADDDSLEWVSENVENEESADITLETLQVMFGPGSREVGDSHILPGVPNLVRAAKFHGVDPVVLAENEEIEASDEFGPVLY